MIFGRFFLLVLLLIAFASSSLLGQYLDKQLVCDGLVKYYQRSIRLQDNGITYVRLGLRYDRASTLLPQSNLILEKQALAGVPLLAGFHLGDNMVLEAGGFVGLNMCAQQETYWFNEPILTARDIESTRGLLIGMGYNVEEDLSLKFQFMRLNDLPENTVLRRFNLGWTWTW